MVKRTKIKQLSPQKVTGMKIVFHSGAIVGLSEDQFTDRKHNVELLDEKENGDGRKLYFVKVKPCSLSDSTISFDQATAYIDDSVLHLPPLAEWEIIENLACILRNCLGARRLRWAELPSPMATGYIELKHGETFYLDRNVFAEQATIVNYGNAPATDVKARRARLLRSMGQDALLPLSYGQWYWEFVRRSKGYLSLINKYLEQQRISIILEVPEDVVQKIQGEFLLEKAINPLLPGDAFLVSWIMRPALITMSCEVQKTEIVPGEWPNKFRVYDEAMTWENKDTPKNWIEISEKVFGCKNQNKKGERWNLKNDSDNVRKTYYDGFKKSFFEKEAFRKLLTMELDKDTGILAPYAAPDFL